MYRLILSTVIHIVAHVFNVEFFVDSHKSNDTLIERLNNMRDTGNESYLNPIRDTNAVSRIHFVCFNLLIRTKFEVLEDLFLSYCMSSVVLMEIESWTSLHWNFDFGHFFIRCQ